MGDYPAVGNVSRLSGVFTDANGAPADPTVVTVVVRAPDGSISSSSPTRDGTGLYHFDLALTMPGEYRYRFVGTGAVTAQSADRKIDVPASTF